MKKTLLRLLPILALAPLAHAANTSPTFGEDLAFLKKHTDILVLEIPGTGARVAVAPAYQGRVMTSTDGGDSGGSLGWIHRKNIAKGIKPEAERTGDAKHIHIFGGEERFWLGPEGGQYSLFFPPAPATYDFKSWKTPALLDTEPFDVVSSDSSRIKFSKDAEIKNRAGTSLKMHIDRTVEILPAKSVEKILGTKIPEGVSLVAYRTKNSVTNTSAEAWTKDKGLISIWLLGMFKHGPNVTVVAPLKPGAGPAVNTDYFGAVEKDRLVTTDKAVFFKADGDYRSKIGIPPGRTTGIAAGYDPDRGILTVVRTVPPTKAASMPYVRSQWMDHKDPYAGDLINVYNDGPSAPGKPALGPFYELETSSPSKPLAPGKKLNHTQETMHFRGTPKQLDPLAQKLLGVSLKEIQSVFAKP
jgi:hypothetical protein